MEQTQGRQLGGRTREEIERDEVTRAEDAGEADGDTEYHTQLRGGLYPALPTENNDQAAAEDGAADAPPPYTDHYTAYPDPMGGPAPRNPRFHPEDYETKRAPDVAPGPPLPSAPPAASAAAERIPAEGAQNYIGGVVAAPAEVAHHPHNHHTTPEGRPLTDRERFEAAHAAAEATEAMECPVCMDEIPVEHMAMRCAGDGGRPHYFHAGCLQEWARTCRTNMQDVRCPVCRGSIQVHRERLRTLLSDPVQTERLPASDRSFLEDLAERAAELGRGGWADLESILTAENVTAAVGMMGAFGHGFWVATRNTYDPISDEIMHRAFEAMTAQARVAHLVGLAAGFTYRFVSHVAESSRDDRSNSDSDRTRRR
eukprot:m.462925 g.462925  ORF g.462925 m.462925 type:complete len:370 (-) comp22836_c0_seq1:233-1342(-)